MINLIPRKIPILGILNLMEFSEKSMGSLIISKKIPEIFKDRNKFPKINLDFSQKMYVGLFSRSTNQGYRNCMADMSTLDGYQRGRVQGVHYKTRQ